MEFLHTPKDLNDLSDQALNGLSDWVLSHWYEVKQA